MKSYYNSGDIKLLKGDSLQLLKKIDDNSIDLIFSDPPYFLSNDGISCQSGKMVSVNKGKWDKLDTYKEIELFNKLWLGECQRILKENGTIWVSGTHHNIYSVGNMMKILVTGGAGFIGSHVVDAYIKAGHKVSVIDSLRTGSLKNLNPRARFYKVDIRNKAAVNRVFKKEKPQIVNHHAAVAEVARSMEDPSTTLDANVSGTVNLLRAFGDYGAPKGRRFIFSSTGGALYGEKKKLPLTEQTLTAPPSVYGLSKLLGEGVIQFYANICNFSYVIFRYPNVYGPRQNPKGEAGVVAIFAGLMKKGKRPTMFGDGKKTRDYVYIDDVVRASALALRRGTDEVMHLGWGREVSDREVFDAVAEAYSFNKDPIYKSVRPGEARRVSLSARKAARVLGWKPRTVFEKGVLKTVKIIA